jgi:hypothetical protein
MDGAAGLAPPPDELTAEIWLMKSEGPVRPFCSPKLPDLESALASALEPLDVAI